MKNLLKLYQQANRFPHDINQADSKALCYGGHCVVHIDPSAEVETADRKMSEKK